VTHLKQQQLDVSIEFHALFHRYNAAGFLPTRSDETVHENLFTVHAQKRPYIYFRLKIWRQIWAPWARFPIGLVCKILNITRCLGQFLLNRLRLKQKTAIFFTSGTTKFGGLCDKVYAYLEQKMAFVMQNLKNVGARGKGVPIFVDTLKGTSSADSELFELLAV